jgi:hypothetical protein
MTDYAKDHVPNWSRRPDQDKLNLLIHWVREASIPITGGKLGNFRRWLVELAYEKDDKAACSNGHDHACNRGLGEWLGIEPYGQKGADGEQLPWDQQTGWSSERLNRHADPKWIDVIERVPFFAQKAMYARMLETLRDTGEFVYHLPADYLPAELDEAVNG